jgi:hypothetical protein
VNLIGYVAEVILEFLSGSRALFHLGIISQYRYHRLHFRFWGVDQAYEVLPEEIHFLVKLP